MIADAQRVRGNGLNGRPWERSAPSAGTSTIWGQILGTGQRPAMTSGLVGGAHLVLAGPRTNLRVPAS
jgi:hypothetical protein